MVVEAVPASALIMAEADFLFQLLIVALDSPTQHGMAEQPGATDGGRQREGPRLAGLGRIGVPFDQWS
ncbi:hypothetical protein GCM10011320_59790 [Neoroseomonas lacus]|uniref:Uncharacterized protein n=1 Tax=Neoroseomonas lacus TaxID=287609 RepID=A0A917P195_9PROT|nr:hypothetical protein GCM10011320_59790 [Neoroseomonas lacus]